MRPTGFEPAAYRVGVIRPSKKKPRFHAGFRYIPQIKRPFAKTAEAFGTPGLPRFFLFLENSSQTVVRGWAEREKSLSERGADLGEGESKTLGFVPVGKATAFLSRYLRRYFLHIVSNNAKSLHLFAKGVLSPLTCLCLYKVFAFLRIFS